MPEAELSRRRSTVEMGASTPRRGLARVSGEAENDLVVVAVRSPRFQGMLAIFFKFCYSMTEFWAAGENKTPLKEATEVTSSNGETHEWQRNASITPRQRAETMQSEGVMLQHGPDPVSEASSKTPRRLAEEMATIASSQLLQTLIRSRSETELVSAKKMGFPDGECHCVQDVKKLQGII
jgi:hypothetical protein